MGEKIFDERSFSIIQGIFCDINVFVVKLWEGLRRAIIVIGDVMDNCLFD